MVNQDKIKKGHKGVKSLDGGIYENLALLRKALNKICEDNSIDKPEELNRINEIFENGN